MAKKPSVTIVASGYQSSDTINSNITALRDAFDNTLSLDGSSPNAMEADLDMNSNDILNASSVHTSLLYINGNLVTTSNLTTVSRPSIVDFGGINNGVTDNTAAFALADSQNTPIFVPEGVFYTTTIPTGKYYGPGKIKVITVFFNLDYAIPTIVNTGIVIDPSDPETITDAGRFFNIIVGQNSGIAINSTSARATTILGSESLQNAVTPVRSTGVGKQVFRYATDIYSCDAFGADALGQGKYMDRSAALSANALKWAGSDDPVARAHDFYRNTGTGSGDFVTAVGLDGATRWPTIRNDFIGSITTPNPSRIPTSSADVSQSVAIGRNALLHSLKSESNVAVGVNAMAHALDNSYNTAVGTRALRDCVSGSFNTAIGNAAAVNNISGISNTAIGSNSLEKGSHTSNNVAIGYNAAKNLTGTDTAPTASPTARRNIYIGSNCGENATDGIFNVAIGSSALFNNSASNNVAIGAVSMYDTTTGSCNTALGFNTLRYNTTGEHNTAIGYNALNENTTGTKGVAVGYNALLNSNADQNTAIGYEALRYTQSGGSLIAFTNCTGVGYNTRVSGDNQVQLGDSTTTTYVYGTVQNRSDMRDKADVRDTILGLDFINALRPVDYRWDMRDDYIVVEEDEVKILPKDGSKKRTRFHHGLIAQEVKDVCNAAGIDFGGYQDHTYNGGEEVMTIGYDELIAPLIKAVQELTARVKELENSVQ